MKTLFLYELIDDKHTCKFGVSDFFQVFKIIFVFCLIIFFHYCILKYFYHKKYRATVLAYNVPMFEISCHLINNRKLAQHNE